MRHLPALVEVLSGLIISQSYLTDDLKFTFMAKAHDR